MRGKHGNHAKASRQHRWKPGGSVAHNGYVKTRVGKDHPLADANGYAYEHHVVWCAAGNPMLAIGQTLHHINGDKTDNRIANLRLMTRAEHNALHIRESGRRCKETGRLLPTAAGRLLDGYTHDDMPGSRATL